MAGVSSEIRRQPPGSCQKYSNPSHSMAHCLPLSYDDPLILPAIAQLNLLIVEVQRGKFRPASCSGCNYSSYVA